MTTHTSSAVICECGHTGKLRLSENDAPFSSMWEDYTLDGFSGEGVTFTSWPQVQAAGPILKHLNPLCPQCGERGRVRFEKGPPG